ncbi:hypothetical protein Esti_000414 [Eimeria stiedai]
MHYVVLRRITFCVRGNRNKDPHQTSRSLELRSDGGPRGSAEPPAEPMGHSSNSSSDGDNYSKSRKKRKAKAQKKRSKKCSSSRPAGEKEHDAFEKVDMEETDRLLLSLLQLSPEIEAELLQVFKQLDSGGTVYLQDLGDPRLRKKLRHLFRSLLVEEVEGEHGRGWRKLPTFEEPLAKLLKRRCKDLRQRAHALPPLRQVQYGIPAAPPSEQEAADSVFAFNSEEAERKANEVMLRWRSGEAAAGREASPQRSLAAEAPGNGAQSPAAGVPVREEWMLEAPAYLRCLAAEDSSGVKRRRAEILRQKKKEDEEAIRVKALMEEWNKARELRSLRDMRKDGELPEGEEAYKRWKRSMDAARNVWGKRAAEHACEQEFKDDAKKGQPWQRFDRDRDLQARPQVSQADYEKLLQQANLSSRFKSSWQTSFL